MFTKISLYVVASGWGVKRHDVDFKFVQEEVEAVTSKGKKGSGWTGNEGQLGLGKVALKARGGANMRLKTLQ